ncbi:MAG: DNA polymerase III subunit delta [Butyrivibrio sp.]|nr:DNA polymerase III subunit delta [Butyrivibrio sp.]
MAAKTSDFNVKQRQLNEDISGGNFKPCYLLYGEEAYLRFQNRDKLLKALSCDASSMNFNRYKGKDIVPAEVIDMAETMPFLADRRVILIEDSGLFKEGCPELAEYLKAPAETVLFIFVEQELDKRKDMFKAVSKLGFEMECEIQTEETLYRWIKSRCANEGKEISPRAQALLVERVGTDMSNIATEIEKLVCYCIDRPSITEEDIEAVCAHYLTSRIFAMTDAISERNQRKAIELYYDMLALKEPPAKILAMITRQFNIMYQVKEMNDRGVDRNTIAGAAKIQPFFVQKYLGWARGYSFKELRDTLELCASQDEAVKTGRLDYVIAVEMVIVRCSRAGKAG